MGYEFKKIVKTIKEGRSFTAAVTRDTAYPTNHVFAYIMKDSSDAIVSTGGATKLNADTSVAFTVPFSDTEGKNGKYIVYLQYTDTSNIDIKKDVREYHLTIVDDKA